MINQILLKTFCTLVNVGHFTKTAEKLFMTQSGVSQQIKKLEKQLDSQLLIREGKTFSLTAAGYQLHQKGLELLRSSDELEALIRQDEAYVGRVNIALRLCFYQFSRSFHALPWGFQAGFLFFRILFRRD